MAANDCPDCGAMLGRGASRCRCGWVGAEPVLSARCAYETCFQGALVKQRTKTGWANFCASHYEEFHTAQSRGWLVDRGLDTREKQVAYWREQRAKLGAKRAGRMASPAHTQERAPGEDG